MDICNSEAHAKCVSSFHEVVSAIENSVRDFQDEAPSILEEMVESFDRYKLWAGNVGAAYQGKYYENSLDCPREEGSLYETQVCVQFLLV